MTKGRPADPAATKGPTSSVAKGGASGPASSKRSGAQTGTFDDAAPRSGLTGLPGALLVFSAGAPLLRMAAIGDQPLVVGRGKGTAPRLALDDDHTSRRHAGVARRSGAFVVTDLGSKNGVFVAGERIDGETTVAAPAVLRVGGSVLVLVDDVGAFEGLRIDEDRQRVAGAAMTAAWTKIRLAARGSRSLLVTGESGTGKELAARAFHAASPRAAGRFVAVNCAAIPEGIAERLLFGARRGAFSGATVDSVGYVEEADGGTLFLDELGELDLTVQAKLLRVLETSEVVPLGATRPRPLALQIVCATNRDLRAAVAEGRFRADLYYRIGLGEVRLPPLRERPEEIPWLVVRAAARTPPLAVGPRLVEACLLRPWPGNVRELLGEVGIAADEAAARGRQSVDVEDLRAAAGTPLVAAADPPRGTPTRSDVERALAAENGNIAGAARALGLHRTQLYRLLKRLGIEPAASE